MALRAMDFTALPLTPPYVVFFSLPMLGQALPLALSPMRPDTVLMAVTPSAPPSLAALAISTMLVTLGVSLANTGMVETSLTQPQMSRTMWGFWPHARPIPLSPMP